MRTSPTIETPRRGDARFVRSGVKIAYQLVDIRLFTTQPQLESQGQTRARLPEGAAEALH